MEKISESSEIFESKLLDKELIELIPIVEEI